MNKTIALLLSFGLLFVAACGSQPQTAHADLPATISYTSAQTSKTVTEKVSAAAGSLLGTSPVTIAEGAFVDSDILVIHRTQLLGRDLGDSVDRFRLVKQSSNCFLIHEGTETRVLLEDVSCEPLP